MKQILTVLSLAFCVMGTSPTAQAAPLEYAERVIACQGASTADNISIVEQRRWPRWLRRLLNRRGNGQRPGGGRRRGGR